MNKKIVIVDDHQLVRDGLASLIHDLDDDFEIIGQGSNGSEAIALAAALRPDIILMDVAMPDMNGIDATRRILDNNPEIKIIALSMHAERTFISGMLQAGAMAYIRKESAFEEISTAMDAISEERVFLGEGIAEIVVGTAGDKDKNKNKLSERETQVLSLIAEGMKTREIAATLFLSEKTVETHRRQISRKLELYSVAEITKYAIREGLTSID
ncbi:MAG: response regulator transcription factor [Pseudomonadota bacterium]